MQTSDWQSLWSEHRYRELAGQVRRGAGDDEGERTLMLARLASVGAISIVEGMSAARTLLENGHDEAAARFCGILRQASSAGAAAWVKQTLDEIDSDELGGEAEALRKSLDNPEGSRAEPSLRGLLPTLAGKEAAELARSLAKGLEENEALAAPTHFETLGALHCAAGDFEKAATAFACVSDKWTHADGSDEAQLKQALCRWLSGDASLAHKTLIELRDDSHAARELRGIASRLVAEVEREQTATDPTWIRAHGRVDFAEPGLASGEAARQSALALAGVSERGPVLPSIDSFAALRHELRSAGLVVWRLALEENTLIAALKAGATVILGEERPLGTGFELIRGFEQNWKVLELFDAGRPGTTVRWLSHQWDRCAFHGKSALLVLGTSDSAGPVAEALAGHGLAHDERFDLVDACDLDQEGQKPHRARADGLTEMAVERAPDVAKSWQRRGMALLELLKSGELDDDRNGVFQRWYSNARERFEDAEWAHQIYADALEYEERYDEAGIAWSDASHLDGEDYRNYLGMARVRAATGLANAAVFSVNVALSLAPSSAAAWTLRARLALGQGDLSTAELAAGLAASLAPDDVESQLVRAEASEQAGNFVVAEEYYRKACELEPDNALPWLRLCRRAMHAGRWNEAEQFAEKVLEIAPGFHGSWAAASQVAFAAGEVEKAFAIARQGIEVTGPYDSLVSALGTSFSALATPGTDGAPLIPLIIASQDAPLDLAGHLVHEGLFEVAQTIHEALIAEHPEAVNPPWRRAQAMLTEGVRRGQRPAGTLELLLDIAERAEGFPYPRMLIGWMLRESDPEKALEVLSKADVEQAPHMIWSALRGVLAACGKEDDAKELDQRLQSMGAGAVLAVARSLASYGLCEEAQTLISETGWLDDDFDYRMSLAAVHASGRDYAKATEHHLAAAEHNPDYELGFAGEYAFFAGAWNDAATWCSQYIREQERISGSNFRDIWSEKAAQAISLAKSGDDSAVPRLVESAGRHPAVLRALCRAGYDEYLPAFAELAPAWHHVFTEGAKR